MSPVVTKIYRMIDQYRRSYLAIMMTPSAIDQVTKDYGLIPFSVKPLISKFDKTHDQH